MKRRRVNGAVLASAVLTGAVLGSWFDNAAWAQPATPNEAPDRFGVTGGLGLGVGSLEIGEESHGTWNYNLHFGGYVTNQWALQVELWGGSHSDEGFQISNHNRGISALYWMRDRNVWWKALFGASSLETRFDGITFSNFQGVAIGGAGGWMFWERGDYHVDAQIRLSIEGFEKSRDNAVAFALAIGVSYF